MEAGRTGMIRGNANHMWCTECGWRIHLPLGEWLSFDSRCGYHDPYRPVLPSATADPERAQ